MPDIASLTGHSAFTTSFGGEVIDKTSPEYEQARWIWNHDFDRHPVAILRPTSVADVVAAVRFARDSGLPTAVRGGGHSYPGHSTCDGLVIDLRRMNAVSADPVAGRVHAGAGALLREVDRATARDGRAMPAGIVSHTGLAGLALGGGIGYLTRSFGLTCDQFVRLRVVTAQGDVVEASEEHNPDLLWGLRGGGGNFGIVTDFECRTHELGPMQTGALFYRMSDAVDVVMAMSQVVANGPRELCVSFGFAVNPAFAPVPDPGMAERLLCAIVAYRGNPDDEPLRALRAVGTPLADTVQPADFLELQQLFDNASAHGTGWYMKSGHTRELSRTLVASLAQDALDHLKVASPNVLREVFSLHSIGGAASDVSDDDSAYSGRSAQWHCGVEVGFTNPEERERIVPWTRAAWERTKKHLDMSTSYVNMMFEDGSDSLQNVYGEGKLDRLRRLKTTWDPDNFFRFNSNIAPIDGPAPIR